MVLNEMDARLISQGSETTAIGSSALVSVSDGEGQPQKNITLGNFADSMGAAVPQQQNAGQVGITGLYARTSEGKMVELTKESVASVMGNLLYGADNASGLASVVAELMQPLAIKGQLSGSFNDAGTGIYYYTSANQNGPGGNYGFLISIYYNGTKLQIAGWAGGDSGLKCRNWYLGGIWSDWRAL